MYCKKLDFLFCFTFLLRHTFCDLFYSHFRSICWLLSNLLQNIRFLYFVSRFCYGDYERIHCYITTYANYKSSQATYLVKLRIPCGCRLNSLLQNIELIKARLQRELIQCLLLIGQLSGLFLSLRLAIVLVLVLWVELMSCSWISTIYPCKTHLKIRVHYIEDILSGHRR